MIPKYVVFNIMKLDLNRNAEVVATGNSKSALRKEYAPTIEMTSSENTKLLDYLELFNMEEFMDFVIHSDGMYEDLYLEELAQAWLHPECIKVVD